jgi:hypothetical protein
MHNVYQFACTKYKVPDNSEVHNSLQNFEVAPKLLENLWTPAMYHFSVKKNRLCCMYVASPQVVPFVRWPCSCAGTVCIICAQATGNYSLGH